MALKLAASKHCSKYLEIKSVISKKSLLPIPYFQGSDRIPVPFYLDIEDLLKQTPLTPPSSEKGSPPHITQFNSDGESQPGSPMYESGR